MLRKFKKEVFGGAASCLPSLGINKRIGQGQETSGFRHSIFFGALANNIKQSRIAPKKDFKQWLYPSPGASELYPFFQEPLDARTEIRGLRSVTVKRECSSNDASLILNVGRARDVQGLALFFSNKAERLASPEQPGPFCQELIIEAENGIESKRGGPHKYFKKMRNISY